MNNKIVILSTLLFVGNATANTKDTIWYAGARAGVAHYNSFESNLSNDLSDDNDFAAGLFLGYNVNEWFSLETGYTYLGKLETIENREITAQTIDLVGKFTWQVAEPLDIFAKAGGATYYTEVNEELPELDDRGISGTVGVGLEYFFSKNVSTRLEYQYYRSLDLDDKGYNSEWDTHLLALGLVYNWDERETLAVTDAPVIEPVVAEPVVEPVVVKKAVMSIEKTAEVHFDTNKSTLSASEMEKLQPVTKHLSDYPDTTIDVIGHADSRGSTEYNQKLSEKRAQTVSEYLIKEYAVSPERINSSGAGESEPIASNATKEGQAKNRRVSVYSPVVKEAE